MDTFFDNEHSIVLVVGATSWDRLLTINSFPAPDAKIRSTNYHECGGGNAANTATTMARLLGGPNRVKLLTKVGGDELGQQIVKELRQDEVDLSSPLFLVGPEGSTTSVTTVLVSQAENTRTCIHTPGSCGELSLHDLAEWWHWEARKRNVTISIDLEKDRKTTAFGELMLISDIVFTNRAIEGCLGRLTTLYELDPLPVPQVVASSDVQKSEINAWISAIQLAEFFVRASSADADPTTKDVVVTKGEQGSFSVRCDEATHESLEGNLEVNTHVINLKTGNSHVVHASQVLQGCGKMSKYSYSIKTVGVLPVSNIVDTTGAGDAYIGAFLVARLLGLDKSAMHFGAWAAGHKLTGPGARLSLPTKLDIRRDLGTSTDVVETSLRNLITQRHNNYP